MVTLPGGREEPHLLTLPLLWCPVGYDSTREKLDPSKGGGKVLELSDSLGGFLSSILGESLATGKEILSIVIPAW